MRAGVQAGANASFASAEPIDAMDSRSSPAEWTARDREPLISIVPARLCRLRLEQWAGLIRSRAISSVSSM
jgi:hypothetical protein